MSDIFKRASKKKLRFNTNKGSLSTEQLWSLSISELDREAIAQKKKTEQSPTESFIFERSKEDADEKLRFDILLEVLSTKYNDQQSALKAQETKAQNQKIFALIREKQDDELKGKSIAELEAMVK